MQKLKLLKPGSTIGIVSPSWWLDPDVMGAGIMYLETILGFKVKVSKQSSPHKSQLAGTDEERVAAIHEMFLDPEVDAIVCACGGYGGLRLLELLDYDLIKKNIKTFMGYSDATAILNAIHTKTGCTTWHGPMVNTFAKTDEETEKMFKKALQDGKASFNLGRHGAKIIQTGTTQGTLIGGNMRVFDELIGTQFFPQAESYILILEEANNEKLNELDKNLLHLKHAGLIPKIKGLMLGGMEHLDDNEVPFGKSITEIIQQYLPKDIPIVTNVPCGHSVAIKPLPLGMPVRLEVCDVLAFIQWGN